MTQRRFPPPWTVTETEGAFVVRDADGQSLAYLYWREPKAAADIAKVAHHATASTNAIWPAARAGGIGRQKCRRDGWS